MEEFKTGKVYMCHKEKENFVEITYYSTTILSECYISVYGYFDNSQEVFDDLREQMLKSEHRFESYFFRINRSYHQVNTFSVWLSEMPQEYKDKVNAKVVDKPQFPTFFKKEGEEITKSVNCEVNAYKHITKGFTFTDLHNDYTKEFETIDSLVCFNREQKNKFKKVVKDTTPDIKLAEKNLDFINEVIKEYDLDFVYSIAVSEIPPLCGYEFTELPSVRGLKLKTLHGEKIELV